MFPGYFEEMHIQFDPKSVKVTLLHIVLKRVFSSPKQVNSGSRAPYPLKFKEENEKSTNLYCWLLFHLRNLTVVNMSWMAWNIYFSRCEHGCAELCYKK